MCNRFVPRCSLPQLLVAVAWFAAASQAGAVVCENPQIDAASLSTSQQTLTARAYCSHTLTETETSVSADISKPSQVYSKSSTATNLLGVTAYADVRWNSESHVAEESIDFTGNSSGTRIATANCGMNPFLDSPPLRSLSCGPVNVQVEVQSGATPEALLAKEFWFRNLLSTEAAKVLSKAAPQDAAPPPPPPPPKVQPAATTASTSNQPVGNAAQAGTSSLCVGADCQAAGACKLMVPYLEPAVPVIETAGGEIRQGDNYRVICSFLVREESVDWPQCDDAMARRVAGYREQVARSAGNRYSGMVDINGATVRVAASPAGGLADFEIEHIWYQKEAGNVAVTCKVDNALQRFVDGSPRYLESSSTMTAGTRVEGRQPVAAADLPARGQAAVLTAPSAAAAGAALPAVQGRALGNDAVNPALNPQPEVPSAKQGANAAGAALPAVQGRALGNDAVNPALNPQPEVPSAKQGANAAGAALPAVQGRTLGNDAVNPALNPQPEVPSAKQGANAAGAALPAVQGRTLGNDAVNPALNPQPEVPSAKQGGAGLAPTAATGVADNPVGQPLPDPTSAPALPDYTTSSRSRAAPTTRVQESPQPPVTGGTAGTSAVPISNQLPAGLQLQCGLDEFNGTVAVTNTTNQRLEQGSVVKWSVYRKGTALTPKSNAPGVTQVDVDTSEYGESALQAPLTIGQTGLVGTFKLSVTATGMSYECVASVLPATSAQRVPR